MVVIDKFKNNLIHFTVFLTGACVLVIEIVAVRLLSPFFGNTIFTMSGVITVILMSLSLGYYFGGKISDKHPKITWFYSLILISGIFVVAINLLNIIITPLINYFFSFSVGPIISSFVLFFVPSLLLGMISPYAIKVYNTIYPDKGIGSVTGEMFFWSTFGSITGSLLTGFVLIPNLGINIIFTTTGYILFLLGALPLWYLRFKKNLIIKFFGLLVIISFIFFLVDYQYKNNFLYYKDGMYENIRIYDTNYKNRPTRLLIQDTSNSGAIHLNAKNPTDMAFEYTKYYSLYKLFDVKIKNALFLGGGSYTMPNALISEFPNANIEVVEIEPELYELSKKYFNTNENIKNHIYDGRKFVKNSNTKYDFIFSDVYHSKYSIPIHFTTIEFFEEVKTKLNDNGVFMINLIGSLSDSTPSFTLSEIKTFKTVFPNSYFFATQDKNINSAQNIIFVAYNSNTPKIKDYNNDKLLVTDIKDKEININNYDLSKHKILTDNYAPVEYMISNIL